MRKILIDEYEKTIDECLFKKNYSKNKNFYVYVDNDLEIFEKASFMNLTNGDNEEIEEVPEETLINNDNKKIICFRKSLNNYYFKHNQKQCLTEFNKSSPDINKIITPNKSMVSNSTDIPLNLNLVTPDPDQGEIKIEIIKDNKRLVFFKFFKYNENEKSILSIKLIKLIDANEFDKILDIKNYYKKLLVEVYKEMYCHENISTENLDIDLWPETYYKEFLNPDETKDLKTKVNDLENISLNDSPNCGIVLIVNMKDSLYTLNSAIAVEIEKSINMIYLKIAVNYNDNIIDKKFPFQLKDKEDILKTRIFSFLSKYNCLTKVLPENTIYFSELAILTSEEFSKNLRNQDIIIYQIERKSNQEIGKYINCAEMSIDFDIRLSSNWTKFEIFDKNNFFVVNLVITNMDNLETAEKVIDYIYEHYLKKEFPTCSKESFYLIYLNLKAGFIYDIVTSKVNDISKFFSARKDTQAFRIQPLNSEESANKLRVFLYFKTRDGTQIKKPMAFFIEVDETWNKLLLDILEKIKPTLESKELTINQNTVRCYKCYINDNTYLSKGEFINYNNDKVINDELVDTNIIQIIVEVPNVYISSNNLSL